MYSCAKHVGSEGMLPQEILILDLFIRWNLVNLGTVFAQT